MLTNSDLLSFPQACALPAELASQLNWARELALYGDETMACEVCASLFLDHLHVFAADRRARAAVMECLVLLGMTHLLRRLLLATDGVSVQVTSGLLSNGLRFPNGTEIWIVPPHPGASRAERLRDAVDIVADILGAADGQAMPSRAAPRAPAFA